MSKLLKKIIFIAYSLLLVLVGMNLCVVFIPPRVLERAVIEEKVIEYEDPQLLVQSIRDVSLRYNLKEDVFYAIIKCEGGTTWIWNKTNDGGYYQINWETAKRYGAQSLKDIIDPRLATELAAKILIKEGLHPWRATRQCIEKELIMGNNGSH